MMAVTKLEDIPTWDVAGIEVAAASSPSAQPDSELNGKISLWSGDMTKLEIDAIVNAANGSLLGGGGIDGAIHRAAGPNLRKECAGLQGCDTGDAKMTSGHDLPARHIVHTVGPIGENPEALASCYRRCLEVGVAEGGLRTLCYCCVSTGIYGYPPARAARVALATVRAWLEEAGNRGKVDRVVFCTFLPNDRAIYKKLLPEFFPLANGEEKENSENEQEEGEAHSSKQESEEDNEEQDDNEEMNDDKEVTSSPGRHEGLDRNEEEKTS
ncbi:unnamed protein product [Heterosigma akashiwo]|mmetsp:Transcript_46803/g.80564  ORF Transcript_46803/g.80564 Transcript_46803/m.80564 type:complete len:269 (-) Transcript_46803:117-923(-)